MTEIVTYGFTTQEAPINTRGMCVVCIVQRVYGMMYGVNSVTYVVLNLFYVDNRNAIYESESIKYETFVFTSLYYTILHYKPYITPLYTTQVLTYRPWSSTRP